MNEKGWIKDFFKKYQMDYEEIDFEEQCRIFIEEMEAGLEGQESTLAMIPTYIGPVDEIPLDEPIIALDAGGTNLRVATVYFNRERQPVIENFHKYSMPGTYGEMSKAEFFQAIAVSVEPLMNKSSRIGFCFSYPMEIMPDQDGLLIRFTKEIRAKEVEGELIGNNLLMALRNRECQGEKKIVLLNDTVATLLAGKATTVGRIYSSYLGFILGTGINACYIEENKKIGKLPGLDPKKSMIINAESGSYGKAPRGLLDLELDQKLNNPGLYVFEKMISGAYLGKLVLMVLKKAGEEEIFSSDFTDKLRKVTDLETKDVDDFLHYPPSLGNPLITCINAGSHEDRNFVYWIIEGILERAALLAAINLTALITKTGRGNPGGPVCITVEGTTFFTLKGLRNKIEYYLKKHLCDGLGYNYEFVCVEHASLVGAAIAGLTSYKKAKQEL